MHCPACKNKLTIFIIANLKILACKNGCGGLWFSRAQLKIIGSLNPGLGLPLLKVKHADGIKTYRRVEHICPYCKTTLLFRHFFSKKFDTEINQCAKCGGLWFDVAGLSNIQSMTGQQKQISLNKYFSTILYKNIKNIPIINEDVDKVVQSIVHVFKFLCPKEDFPE